MGNDMFGVDIHNENEPLRMLENRDHQFDSQSGGDQRNAGSRDGTLLIKGPIFGRLNGQQKYTDKYKKKLEKFVEWNNIQPTQKKPTSKFLKTK